MKRCSKCGEIKFDEEFYKSSSTSDGLQPWCKVCQNESSKKSQLKKKLQKRNTQLKRFSDYHLRKGLKYKLLGPQKKGSNRQLVEYECLDCGKKVESTLELAWAYKFKCDDCRLKGVAKPLFLTKSQEQKEEKNQKLYNKLNDCKSSCNNEVKCKSEENCNCEQNSCKGLVFDNLAEVLKALHAKEEPEDIPNIEHVKVIVIEKPVIQNIPVTNTLVKEKKGFFTWLKNLFKPRKIG